MDHAASAKRVHCRLIVESDLDAVCGLLCEGFPGHSRAWWRAGLDRLASRNVPRPMPRFGYCLDTGQRLAGVILLIASVRDTENGTALFCNVASWYVKPAHRGYAQLLVSMALKHKHVTYTNVSPAPHTWPIVEKQGYARYCGGLFFAAALLKRPDPRVRIVAFDPERHLQLSGADLLRRHREMGCSAVVAEEAGKSTGFVFRRYSIRAGRLPLPALFAIHAPDRQELVRLAGNIARYYTPRLAPFIVMDADGPVAGLPGVYTEARGRKYYKGPHRPALCDLADTEYAIFGF